MNGLFPEIDTQAAIVKASESHELVIQEFFEAWIIPVPIMSERLRLAGYHVSSRDLHLMANSEEDSEHHMMNHALKVVLLEMRNDIDKVLNLEI